MTNDISALKVDDAPALAPASVQIRPFRPGSDDSHAFRLLNEEWINRHFILEEKDREVLGDPEKSILGRGGHIFMAEADTQPVGCVAITPVGDGVYELSKMAISPRLRGQGIGRRLLQHVVAEVRRLGAKSLFLSSSTRLPTAVHLYESLGFRHVPRHSLPNMPYVRPDVFMTLAL